MRTNLRVLALPLALFAAGCAGDPQPQRGPLVAKDSAQSAYVTSGNGIAEYAPGASAPRLLAAAAQAQAGSLAVAPDGTMWFASYLPLGTNLFSYDPVTHVRHAYANRGPVIALAVSPRARAALGTPDGTVAEFVPHRYTAAAVYRSRERVVALRYDGLGRLWIARTHALERLDPGAARPRQIARADGARALAADAHGGIYLEDARGLRVFDRAGRVIERRRIRLQSGGTFAVDRNGNRYVADAGECDRAAAMVRVYHPGRDTSDAQAGPYETVESVTFDDRDRVYVNASTCPSDLRFPWEPSARVDIFEPGLRRLIATREAAGGRIAFGPRALFAPMPLSAGGLRRVPRAAFEYRLYEDGRLEKRRRRGDELLWSRYGVRAFAVDARSGGVIAATATAAVRLSVRGRAVRAYPTGPIEALRLAPSGAFVTVARPPGRAGGGAGAAVLTAYDARGRRGGRQFAANLTAVRLDARERIIVGDIDEIRVYDPALRALVARSRVDSAITSVAYDRRTGEIDVALLNGEIERLGRARAARFVPGADGTDLVTRDGAGNLWTVSPPVSGGAQRLAIFAPEMTRPARSIALPAGLRTAAIVPDGDGTAVLIEAGPERGGSHVWEVERDGRVHPEGTSGLRSIAFADR